ncbi:MAG: hypothetical protein R2761_14215 [Acidimicrobiales bacterium]
MLLDHATSTVVELVASFSLLIALFLVLQPETYGLTPNSTDPVFYSALGINFHEASRIGASHYAMSRWSSWYPLYLANAVAGPTAGRLLLRLLGVSALIVGLWRLRPDWSWGQRTVAAITFATMPMFIRPLMTDYVESTIVTLGTALVLMALRRHQSVASASIIGALTALLIVANPFTVTATVAPLAIATLGGSTTWRGRIKLAVAILIAAASVIVLGLLYFRYLYQIPNIYQPTIDFLRGGVGPDPLKSPRLEWLGRFTWLYVTPMVLVAWGVVARCARPGRLDAIETRAAIATGIQYGLHWVDQFGRDGAGLEIPYYWSATYCTLGVSLALLVGRLVRGRRPVELLIAVATGLNLLLIGVPDGFRLPAGAAFFALAAGVAAGVAALVVRRRTATAAAALVTFAVWAQIGAPPYDPTAYHPYNLTPQYDHLFWGDGEASESAYREGIWFLSVLDQVEDQDQSLFLPVSGWAAPLIGLYQAQLGQRAISTDSIDIDDPAQRYWMLSDPHRWLVILGLPDVVGEQVTRAEAQGLGPPVVDVTHDRDIGYRVAVMALGQPHLPLAFPPAKLTVGHGTRTGASVAHEGGEDGFVTYGPYVPLPSGRYTARLRYRSTARSDQVVGAFDAFGTSEESVAAVDITGTGGRQRTVDLGFTVHEDGQSWEFRTVALGGFDLTVDGITVDDDR